MNYRLFIFAALFLFQNTFSQVKPENDIIAVQQSRIISDLRTRIDFGKKTLKQQVFDSTKINSSLQKIMELNDKTSSSTGCLY